MSSTTITGVLGRRVWDSRGRPTVEADIRLSGGGFGRAIAPAGASTGSGEAVDLRDGGGRFGGLDVTRALAAVTEKIAPALTGLDAADQAACDRAIEALDPDPGFANIGGNAAIAVSMALAHAAADAAGQPLWRHLAGSAAVEDVLLPLPEIQIFGGGAHASARIDMQDIMVMPVGAASFAEALDMVAEVYRAAGGRLSDKGLLQGVADEGGFWPAFDTNEDALAEAVRAIEAAGFTPGEDLGLSLDIAATQLRGGDGLYRFALEDRALDRDDFAALLAGWVDRYPVVSIEDPLAEDETGGMVAFTDAVRGRCQVIGDDYLVTDAARVAAGAAAGACTAVLVKPNQAGTLTRTHAALAAGKAAGWGTIVSARSGETEDVTIAHLAVGWRAGQFKVGSFARSERMAKWNEMLRIEEAAGGRARFAGRGALAMG